MVVQRIKIKDLTVAWLQQLLQQFKEKEKDGEKEIVIQISAEQTIKTSSIQGKDPLPERAKLIPPILKTLGLISKKHKKDTLDAEKHIKELFALIDIYYEKNKTDPIYNFLTSLYNGLTYNDAWMSLNPSVYKTLKKMLTNLSKQHLTYEKIDKYLLKLLDLGINILPY